MTVIVDPRLFLFTVVAGIFFALLPLTLASAGEPQNGKLPAPATAIFAGGCFWCMEEPFAKEPGVLAVTVGYTGGRTADPTYETYAEGGHLEAVRVTFDPQRVSYQRLLDIFWHQIDPTDAGGQFVDRGPQYASAIFVLDEEQRRAAEGSRRALATSGVFRKPIVTPIRDAGPFYPAEEYHQHYARKNPLRYRFYRHNAGRDQFLEQTWGAGLRQRLSPMAYHVTQEDGTEPPFDNAYWNHKEPGIYVDVVSGEPLFSSTDKYDSGTGWPSFTRPLVADNIVLRPDRRLFLTRTEVRSRRGDSHLGHVFDDGPPPTGKRYCINSAALRFVPADQLEAQGYGEFRRLFPRPADQ